MKPVINPARSLPPADPKIVRKVRRDHATYPFSESLPGEQNQEYLSRPSPLPSPLRLAEFGRPGL